MDSTPHVDLLVVGAGVIGLAHAARAHAEGRSVLVIDREHAVTGASVRNFGHVCVTSQAGEILDMARLSRERWIAAGEKAGFEVEQCGTVVVARTETELAVLTELADERGPEAVRMLTADGVRDETGLTALGGALMPADLRVDPRVAAPTFAAWLGEQDGVEVQFNRSYLGHDSEGVARTSRGDVRADHTIVCVGHDVDQLHPDLGAEFEIRRCRLQMALVRADVTLRHPILSGTSMLRYGAYEKLPSIGALARELAESSPELMGIDANLMTTQRPDGTLLVGDSHHRGYDSPPFLDEGVADVLLGAAGELLGTDLEVRERWQGVYASSPHGAYLRRRVAPDVTVVSVTTGVGMTIAHGLAATTEL